LLLLRFHEGFPESFPGGILRGFLGLFPGIA
jgi:hypothetical protein